jgi:hypothetical protein
MPTPILSSYQSQLFNTAGSAVPGATISVLLGQTDTVNISTQPGSPLGSIYADPYGNSQIPQTPITLAGTVSTIAGSPNVALAAGSQLSQFLVGNIIVINGVQYTVAAWISAIAIVLATNAQSTGTFTYSAAIPVAALQTDGFGNFQFWTEPGYYVLQIYDPQMPNQFIQGITVGGEGGGGGGGGISDGGFGNGTPSEIVTTTLKGSGTGPTLPTNVVRYAQWVDPFNGQTYYIPLMQ